MSSKICMSAWNGGPWKTKDTVTLGQLDQMIAALGLMGYDMDTPVTFLFDDEHAWLETVEWDEDEGPRVVDELGDPEKDADWIDDSGDTWHWDDGVWMVLPGGGWNWRPTGLTPSEDFGPYTEVVE